MQRALDLATQAASEGEVPVGALVVHQGEIVGEGYNSTISASDPTAHAEVVALRRAATRLNNYRLPDTRVFVTLEPCTMCVGALIHARISELVFAAREPRTGAVVSCASLLDQPWHNHRIKWQEGVLADDSTALMQQFFRARRQ